MLLVDPSAQKMELKSNKMFPEKETARDSKQHWIDRGLVSFVLGMGKSEKICEVGIWI